MKYIDSIPKVPNLSSPPSNPSFEDCYYNLIDDNYYIYDGNKWLMAVRENKEEDYYTLKYKNSSDSTYTVEEFSSYEDLSNRLKTGPLGGYTDWIIREGKADISNKAVLCCRSSDAQPDEIAFLKYANPNDIDYSWDIVGIIYPKVIFNKHLVENVNMNDILVFYTEGV